jgi:hypothetical protein
MRIRVTTPHSLGGGVDVNAGDVIEVSDVEARRKVAMNFAESVDELPASSGVISTMTPPAKPEHTGHVVERAPAKPAAHPAATAQGPKK